MNPAFQQMATVRAQDRFHASQDAEALVSAFHPRTTAELALDLSNVTSAFYAVLLQCFAETHGAAGLDAASRRFFYRLGRLKARATRDGKAEEFRFEGDVRDVVTIVISAIYNASPEYQFQVHCHRADLCVLDLTGTDRYLRAARQLDIARHLQWPTLHPFLEGVAEELGIAAEVNSEVLATGPDAILHTRYRISAR